MTGRLPLRPEDVVEGDRIRLRPVRLADATERYVGWLNDPEVNRYLESRFETATVESVREFVAKMAADPNHALFAIERRDDSMHVGNIKLGPVNWRHRFGEIGLIIGDRECWGRGVATEAITLITAFAFERLHLHRVSAGCYEPNAASARAFERAGFSREGVRRSCFLCDGAYVDAIMLGRVNTHDGPAGDT
ncbi:MAG TPA: GNAT family N-acetyltransferase [Vicinamibacterales bacterium]|nr:GNAT family N-acetyltransferase [Vicinamibacterales bacterium]